MNGTRLTTRRLTLIPETLESARARIEAMPPEWRAEVSPEWLAQLDSPDVDVWTLGFAIAHRDTDAVIGSCGFKGPPGTDGSVEVAYGIEPAFENQGYATEATEALMAFAFRDWRVGVVRAHTLNATNASARVLTKCGFQSVGEVIDPEDGPVWRWEYNRVDAA